jgi:hypothetical protein
MVLEIEASKENLSYFIIFYHLSLFFCVCVCVYKYHHVTNKLVIVMPIQSTPQHKHKKGWWAREIFEQVLPWFQLKYAEAKRQGGKISQPLTRILSHMAKWQAVISQSWLTISKS